MSNLTGAENSHRALPPIIGADYSVDEASITDFKEIFLSTPESDKLFQIWFSKQNDPDETNAFLSKLKYFSLSTPTIMALFLFCLLYTSPSPRDATLSRMPSSA